MDLHLHRVHFLVEAETVITFKNRLDKCEDWGHLKHLLRQPYIYKYKNDDSIKTHFTQRTTYRRRYFDRRSSLFRSSFSSSERWIACEGSAGCAARCEAGENMDHVARPKCIPALQAPACNNQSTGAYNVHCLSAL